MRCVGIVGTFDATAFASADHVVQRLSEISIVASTGTSRLAVSLGSSN
jgi:hypothetical protein